MRACETSVTINAPAHLIWLHLTSVCAWPRWLPTVTSVTPLGVVELGEGLQYRVVQPKLRPSVWCVTEVSAGKSFTWITKSPGLIVTAEHMVSPTSATTSTVFLRVSFHGLLSPLAFPLARRLTSEYIQQEGLALRNLVESLHGAA